MCAFFLMASINASFKLKHGICKLDVSGEEKSADQDAVSKYCKISEKLVKNNDLATDKINTAHETGWFQRCLPTLTLAGGDETSVNGIQKHKDKSAVLTCTNVAGTQNLKLLVTGIYNQLIAFKWYLICLFIIRLRKALVSINKFYLVKQNLQNLSKTPNSKCILLDNCRAHPSESCYLTVEIIILVIYHKI